MPPVAVNPNLSRASRSTGSALPATGVPVAVAVDANRAAAPQAVVRRPAPATQPSSTQVAAEAQVWLTCARLGPLLTRAFDAMRATARYPARSGASARHFWP